MQFTELDLPQQVQQGIDAMGFTVLTPVQEQSIPLALDGKDVAAQAQTGTGKTAAFLISLFARLIAEPCPKPTAPRALILAPTRELVVQIAEDATGLGRFSNFTIQPIFGGVDYEKQRQALHGGVDIIIATPGRLIDYAKQGAVSLGSIQTLVIDEADRMFDMGFIRDLRYILRKLPPFERRQTMLFSATLSQRVMELAYEFMNLAEKVKVAPEMVTAEQIEEVLYHVARREKFALLMGLLKKEPATCVMLFVNTKREAERLSGRLRANGFKAALISGDIPQKKRMRILDDFKEGRIHFLVGTDVASRGIHVDGVTHVINYDLPQDREDYVHRVGRTARAGAAGKAISFADEDTVFYLADIEDYIGHRVPSVFPEDSDFCHDFKSYTPAAKKPVRPRGGAPATGAGKDRPRRRRPSGRTRKTSSQASEKDKP
ncbi:MAG: DEAD/DEAH box helicase [Syntrophotalea acetylenica]|jgi:ATP-dependent RNA helicase RhlB|uniref:DEAD/DEAH box helicase n=1 Tax=Syntrophotalea TaxID=2812025 RepID=UPI002A372625|nr:DEAD/DEAH box helicase [Syntrophotalea acetylenica]MDD4456701.1 DEAD/DEAH box helicase [Syntrophotalea acetylenica]MDY0261878.1 DEAD/DEAH box helicase [Syntrophotalea acetylenica]